MQTTADVKYYLYFFGHQYNSPLYAAVYMLSVLNIFIFYLLKVKTEHKLIY